MNAVSNAPRGPVAAANRVALAATAAGESPGRRAVAASKAWDGRAGWLPELRAEMAEARAAREGAFLRRMALRLGTTLPLASATGWAISTLPFAPRLDMFVLALVLACVLSWGGDDCLFVGMPDIWRVRLAGTGPTGG